MPDRALRPKGAGRDTLEGIAFESMNARQGIKTLSGDRAIVRPLPAFESMNARQGIKTQQRPTSRRRSATGLNQ